MTSASNPGVSVDSLFKDRVHRTMKLSLDVEGRPYSRKGALDHLIATEVPCDAIEAIGVRERNVEWEVTMRTTPAWDHLVSQRQLEVKGKIGIIGGIRKSTRRLRIFYLPYYVPINTITQQFVRNSIEVLKIYQDKDRETGLMSNVWNLVIDADVPECVPDQLHWSFDGMSGRVLVNVIGRELKCLRCSQRGHRKFECRAPYCAKCHKVGHEESDDCMPQ